ncbi:MAG: DUF3592 domain-containing protein [Xanthobacteraceae bacterium]
MGRDKWFWTLFGGILFVVGLFFFAASFGVNLFADPNQLEGGSPLLFAAAGIVATGIGGSIVYFAWRAAARDERLMQIGVPVTATVLDVRRSRLEINRQSRWVVLYRYEYPKGQVREGKSGGLIAEEVMEFKPGDAVQIKVDPHKPEESLFLGRA